MNSNFDTETTVKKIMALFNEEYPNKFVVSVERERLWVQLLRDCPSNAIEAAAYHLVSIREDWPPSVATVRITAIRILEGELSPPSASEAWEHVQLKIQNKNIELTDLEKLALKQTGSIFDLRHSSNQIADRSRFLQAFEACLKKRDEDWMTTPRVKQFVQKIAENKLLLKEKNEPKLFEKTEEKIESESTDSEKLAAIEESKKRIKELIGVEL